ncbi:MAG: macro domain-containing protein [Candidatus Eremiobacteraeota bacterium]|nr:macro domain-containing protein [Candidatus Eremiobacteraeota bacterium]
MAIEVSVFQGSALEVKGMAALVIPANRQLSLGWGSHLSELVRKEAGSAIEREALEAHPGGIALGEAVLTGAGSLRNFTHIIHAAVLDKYDFNPLFLLRLKERTSRDVLARAVHSSLEAAAKAGIGSLVFTPMGAGIGGMADGACAVVMRDAIRAFDQSTPESPVRNLVIACLGEKTAGVFRKAFA